jgi:two-component system chemotaxis response regulator CheB
MHVLEPESKIIVIGTSAGGMDALTRLLQDLSPDFAPPIFIVQHLSPHSTGSFLVKRLTQITHRPCELAQHGAPFEPGRVYMAPADHHLLIKRSKMLVAKGPHENQFRPAIDPLFRSAAAHFGSAVIGVILTGFMSDGLAGIEAVSRAGGITVVQDPADAEFPDLPRNVLRYLTPSHLVPLTQMGALRSQLAQQPAPPAVEVPRDIKMEAEITERIMTHSNHNHIEDLEKLGSRAPYSCPDCGGALWAVKKSGEVSRFRCQTGHTYTDESLLQGMSSSLEETLWVAMRALEERRNLLLNMAQQHQHLSARWAASQQGRAEEMKVHIERLRNALEISTMADAEAEQKTG